MTAPKKKKIEGGGRERSRLCTSRKTRGSTSKTLNQSASSERGPTLRAFPFHHWFLRCDVPRRAFRREATTNATCGPKPPAARCAAWTRSRSWKSSPAPSWAASSNATGVHRPKLPARPSVASSPGRNARATGSRRHAELPPMLMRSGDVAQVDHAAMLLPGEAHRMCRTNLRAALQDDQSSDYVFRRVVP